MSDIVDSAGVVFMTPTYESEIFPPVSNFLELLRIKKLGEEKHAAAFATKMWGGKAPALLASRLKEAGFSVFEPVGDYVNYPSENELRSIREHLLSFSQKALEGL
jgi:flavorubredoxin